VEKAWTKGKDEIVESLKSDPKAGISQDEAKRRLEQYGPNRLVKERTITWWGVFKEEITEPMILLLLVVGIFYAIWGELRDVITIFTVIVLLVFAEVFTEYRAKKSITALRRLSPQTTPVIRGGAYARIPAAEIVPGDIVPLEAGDHVPADGRVIDSFGLQVDESALTGESLPVNKDDAVLTGNAVIADRINMAFAGTVVTGGRGLVVITGTGMDTELGRVTGLVLEGKEPRTQLQQAMRDLAGLLVWVAVAFSVVIPLIGILQGKPYKDMILTGLSLSFATIPEELPIIITMVLGVGALALSKRHVLIRRLRAAETLGGVTVIVTDKTGTITENRMTLSMLATRNSSTSLPSAKPPEGELRLLEAGVLTSHIKKTADGHYTGDPLDVAIIEAASSYGLSPENIQSRNPLKREFSFDNRRKMMSAIFNLADGTFVYAKGAPEIIMAKSSMLMDGSMRRAKTAEDVENVAKRAESMAAEAMRVIAFAFRKVDDNKDLTQEEAESNLEFLGLAGFADPPRAGVKDAIQATKAAGIRTIVVSGDLPLTVQKVAAEVGIGGGVITGAELAGMDQSSLIEKLKQATAFARTNPKQKLEIVQALQKSGEVVAVTGDGINDAPALKSADIGVAMGETGTEVAREAADMVLTDDSFTSIVDGVREGRKIFDNLRKGLTYYLSVKIALVLSFVVPLALSLSFPFAPVQIVLLELFMDLAASATFVAEPMETDTMRRPPRPPRSKFIDRELLSNISLGAISLSAAVLFNYLFVWYNGQGLDEARSVAFGTWLVGHIFLAFTMRSQREPLTKVGLFSNKVMLVWAGAAFAFLIFIIYVPFVQPALKVTTISPFNWLLVIGVPAITIFWHELRKMKRT
jgi:P-type Ca2+ transporter type 2C